jgi:hypothetical protein
LRNCSHGSHERSAGKQQARRIRRKEVTAVAGARPKTFLAGAAIVWRHQRVVWLVYFANLLLALVGTRGAVAHTGEILNSSLLAERLVHGFDLGAYGELALHPSLPFGGSRPMMLYSAMLFALFMLFATGGMLTAYFEDRRLTAGNFFQACGEHFWRFLRLLIWFAIALIPVGILMRLTGVLYRRVDRQSISPFPAVHVAEVAAVIILLLMMCLRLWFDMAQVIAVAEGEKNMRRALKSSAILLQHNFGSLFWLYFRISALGWFGFWFVLYTWMEHLRPEAIARASLVSQALIVFWLAIRLWQRASEALWYRERLPELMVPARLVPPSPVQQAPSELQPV